MVKDQKLAWAVARTIQEARKATENLTQSRLADFAGLSLAFIERMERGTVGISIASLRKMAAVLKLHPAELMRRIEEEMQRGPRPPERSKGGRPRKKATEKSKK